MSLFKTFSLSEKQTEMLNSYLPDSLQKSQFTKADFEEQKLFNSCSWALGIGKDRNRVKQLNNELDIYDRYFYDKLCSMIIIYNIEPKDAKPFGMVDIGVVERFGSISTGSRFDNGVVGYAIEQGADEVWANNNAQSQAVESAKLMLLKKAKDIYPECNSLYKFEIDFREIGSSGNVFLFLRGTACVEENEALKLFIEKNKDKKGDLQNELDATKALLREKEQRLFRIPRDIDEVKTKLPND